VDARPSKPGHQDIRHYPPQTRLSRASQAVPGSMLTCNERNKSRLTEREALADTRDENSMLAPAKRWVRDACDLELSLPRWVGISLNDIHLVTQRNTRPL
jgi:hypothetical protein